MRERLQKLLLASLGTGCNGPHVRRLRVGTDCAGAEAPTFALREISRSLEVLGVDLQVDHTFACDINPASREFIVRNCHPMALFGDLLARDRISHCLLAERPRMVPSDLDVYVAGFPCKDFSMLNRKRECLDGPNAEIFHGVVEYIRRHEPRTYVLENVWGLTMSRKGEEAPIHEVMRTLREIPNYQVRGWRVNTLDYFLPQNRKRIYIVGVHTGKVRLLQPLTLWGRLLKELRGGQGGSTPHDFMLSDSEPEVCMEYERLSRREPPRRPVPGKFGFGLRWMARHRLLRTSMGLDDVHPATEGGRGWTCFLGPRAKDVLDLAAAKAGKDLGRPAECSRLVSEISRGAGYCGTMDSLTPCVVPTGRLWVFSRWRWMIGLEKLALQGFAPDSLDLSCLTEAEIEMLAGNAMSVPVIGAFLYLVLALVRFPQAGDAHAEELPLALQLPSEERSKRTRGPRTRLSAQAGAA